MNLETLITCLSAVVSTMVISLSLIPFAHSIAYKIGAVDVPRDARRMHSQPTPRTGGIAIAAALLIGLYTFIKITPALHIAIAGAFVILLAGVGDDMRSICAAHKLLLQMLAATLAYFGGFATTELRFFGAVLPLGVFSFPVTLLWIVTLLNAHNFIDGIDGLCGSIGAVEAFFLAILALSQGLGATAIVPLLLVGALLGFLAYNLTPARIFMGDTGSMLIGYTLALLSIKTIFMGSTTDTGAALAVFALPLADITWVTVRRIISGKSPFCADKGHIHHILAAHFGQKNATRILTVSAILFPLMLLTWQSTPYIPELILIFLALALVRRLFRQEENNKK